MLYSRDLLLDVWNLGHISECMKQWINLDGDEEKKERQKIVTYDGTWQVNLLHQKTTRDDDDDNDDDDDA